MYYMVSKVMTTKDNSEGSNLSFNLNNHADLHDLEFSGQRIKGCSTEAMKLHKHWKDYVLKTIMFPDIYVSVLTQYTNLYNLKEPNPKTAHRWHVTRRHST